MPSLRRLPRRTAPPRTRLARSRRANRSRSGPIRPTTSTRPLARAPTAERRRASPPSPRRRVAADDRPHRRYRGREVRGAGGLSSGLGAATLSSDAVVHELLDSEPLLGRLVERWGPEVGARGRGRPQPDRRDRLRRPRAADLAGGSRSTRWSASGSAAWLAVAAGGRPRSPWSRCRCCSRPGWSGVFDTTVAIVTADEVRRERAAARGHALVDEREARQLAQEEKAARAEHVVENDGSVEDLERALSALIEKLRG